MLVHSSSPLGSFACSTPTSFYSARSHQPMNSSPLASPSYSSPTHDARERRRAQYKSVTPTSHCTPSAAKLLFRSGNQTSVDPQKVFLRERLQARCREHAQKLRERAVNSRRSSDRCSDIFMECEDDDEEEETDDAIMQDELFRRIIQGANKKMNHSYRVSYAFEVGSSFDPDMEDATVWESELQEQKSGSAEPTPDDLEEEELEYVEQYAAFADFADLDLDEDDIATLSDYDDVPTQPGTRQVNEMDLS